VIPRHPSTHGWPAWIRYQPMHDTAGLIWLVECEVCGQWTGRRQARDTLARFLKRHRRCGL